MIITAVIGSVSVMLLFVGYCMYRRRCSKGMVTLYSDHLGKDDKAIVYF